MAGEYNANTSTFKQLCQRAGCDSFIDYTDRNWNLYQGMWVMYRRAKLPHFNNYTNTGLENFFGKYKDSVKISMSVVKCVESLMAIAWRCDYEYAYKRIRVGRFANSEYDKEVSQALRIIACCVAELIAAEYAAASFMTDVYRCAVNGAAGKVVVQGALYKHHLLA